MNTQTSTSTTHGMGEDYNENSLSQMAAIQSSAPYIQQAIDALAIHSTSLVLIADYGSSHGANSMYAMKYIIQSLKDAKKIDDNKQQILVVHNDLSTNDWTSLFNVLLKDSSYNAVASGRSFYERCLPSGSLAIGYCSISMHWLSRKPCNLSDQCLVDYDRIDPETTAFKQQAALDYAHFLEYRSHELMSDGVLILVVLARSPGAEIRKHANLLYRCAQAVLSPEELLDYTLPIYSRSYAECVNHELFTKLGLELITADYVSVKSPFAEQLKEGKITLDYIARVQTMAVRIALEYPLRQMLIARRERSTDEINKILDQYWTIHEEGIKEKPFDLDNDLSVINIVLRKIKK